MAMSAGASGTLSPAAQYLQLGDQAGGESEADRRRRLAALQAAQSKIGGGLARGYGAAISPAGQSLGFGG